MTETVPERMARRAKERQDRQAQRAIERSARAKQTESVMDKLAKANHRPLQSYSDTQLLAELIKRNALQDAPRKIAYAANAKMKGVVLGIGKDHHAEIFIGAEDLEALHGIS